jgi:hypothetical protein
MGDKEAGEYNYGRRAETEIAKEEVGVPGDIASPNNVNF